MKPLLSIIFLAVLAACSEPAGNTDKQIVGLTVTDISGHVLSEPIVSYYPRCDRDNYYGHTDPFFCIHPPYPNPSDGEVNIEIEVEKDCSMKVMLADSANSYFLVLFDGEIMQGSKQIKFDFSNLKRIDGSKLAKKKYFLSYEAKCLSEEDYLWTYDYLEYR